MNLYNVTTTAGLGQAGRQLLETENYFGNAKIKMDTNVINGNLAIHDVTKKFVTTGFKLDIGYVYNSQRIPAWRLNQGKKIAEMLGEINQPNSKTILEEPDGHLTEYIFNSDKQCYESFSDARGLSTLTFKDGQWCGWNSLSIGLTH
jgi:hypothetical protein